MNVILFDNETAWKNLLPLTYTRPVAAIRIGILTIQEKWNKWLNTSCSYQTQAYLSKKYALREASVSLYIQSGICPSQELVTAVTSLAEGCALVKGENVLAFKGSASAFGNLSSAKKVEFNSEVFEVKNVWDIFQKNGDAIRADFALITHGRKSVPLSSSVTVIGNKDLVFLEEGAKAEACILNTSGGPVYLGSDSEIMEGSAIRGPFSLGDHSTLKLNAKVYGPSTVGPHCKVGGEMSNSVIFGFTNKAHDGFIGNSVLGEWCNLGADTNSSNLKNNYASIKLFNYLYDKPTDSGLQFCGLIMGDHSKTGINTMLNTGTVVGVGANIFGGGFPATHIPSFSWGGAQGFETYRQEKLFETAEKVFERRAMTFDATEKEMLNHIFSITSAYRND